MYREYCRLRFRSNRSFHHSLLESRPHLLSRWKRSSHHLLPPSLSNFERESEEMDISCSNNPLSICDAVLVAAPMYLYASLGSFQLKVRWVSNAKARTESMLDIRKAFGNNSTAIL